VYSKLLIRYIAAVHVSKYRDYVDSELTLYSQDVDFDIALTSLLRLVLKLNHLEYSRYDWGCAIAVRNILQPLEKLCQEVDKFIDILRGKFEEMDENELKVPKDVVLNAFKNVDVGDLDKVVNIEKQMITLGEGENEVYIRIKFMPTAILTVAKSREILENVVDYIDDPCVTTWEINYIAKFLEKHVRKRRSDHVMFIYPLPGRLRDVVDVYNEFVKKFRKSVKKVSKTRK